MGAELFGGHGRGRARARGKIQWGYGACKLGTIEVVTS